MAPSNDSSRKPEVEVENPDGSFSKVPSAPENLFSRIGKLAGGAEAILGDVFRAMEGSAPRQDLFKASTARQARLTDEAFVQALAISATEVETLAVLKKVRGIRKLAREQLHADLEDIMERQRAAENRPEAERELLAGIFRQDIEDTVNHFRGTVEVGVRNIARELGRDIHPDDLPREQLPEDTRTLFERLLTMRG